MDEGVEWIIITMNDIKISEIVTIFIVIWMSREKKIIIFRNFLNNMRWEDDDKKFDRHRADFGKKKYILKHF